MGLEFLLNHGGSRIRQYEPQPFLLDDGLMEAAEGTQYAGLSYEQPADKWRKIDVSQTIVPEDWSWKPHRFIDGKHVGRVATCLFSAAERYPVPVYLSQIGAIEMRETGGKLQRFAQTSETVVVLMAHLFGWEEVESFADALHREGYRMLIAEKPKPLKEGENAAYSYDFERMRKTTHNRSNDEMLRHEKQIIADCRNFPTVVDGRLEPRAGAIGKMETPTVGVIKKHSKNYLHPHGWQTFYELREGQRTPAFLLTNENEEKKEIRFEVVSWYLRLEGSHNEMPNYGVVRVEVPAKYLETEYNGSNQDYINRLSRVLCDYRSRDAAYNREAVSIYPIQRAEESLGSLFKPTEAELGRFYRLTKL